MITVGALLGPVVGLVVGMGWCFWLDRHVPGWWRHGLFDNLRETWRVLTRRRSRSSRS